MPPPHRFRARLAKSTILNTKVTGHCQWHVPRGYRCTQLALAAVGAGLNGVRVSLRLPATQKMPPPHVPCSTRCLKAGLSGRSESAGCPAQKAKARSTYHASRESEFVLEEHAYRSSNLNGTRPN
jgi:hypothetical protein